MAERFYHHVFDNGLTLLAEQMPAMQSAAMTLLIPAGAATDPAERCGSATVLSDLILRGAGRLDSRSLSDYLDTLGLQRSSSVGIHHTRLACAGLGPKVFDSLAVYADIARKPHLPAEGFDAARDLALQSLMGVEDDPRHKLMVKLRQWHLPCPYGRNTMGEMEHLRHLTVDHCRQDHAARYRPGGAILAVAGNLDFDRVRDEVQRLFADWRPGEEQAIELRPPPGPLYHEPQPTEQTHIGIAWPSVPETDDDYYIVRLAVEVLCGGMSGRLFTEVREKRGLCYHVSAGYSSLKDYGAIFGYAGTSNDRAQETLDTFIAELNRLSEGVTAEELERAKIGLKATTIMQGESTGARCAAIAHDWFMRGRLRTLEEIKSAIDSVSLDQVNDYLRINRPGPFTLVTVGPRPLKIPRDSA